MATYIDVSGGPQELCLSSDASYLWVANTLDNNAQRINTSTNMIVTTVSTGNGPFGICLSKNQDYVYTANTGSGSITRILNSSPYTATSSPTNVRYSLKEVVASPTDNNTLWVLGGFADPSGNSLYKLNGPSLTLTGYPITDASSIDISGNNNQLGGIIISPDGNYLYISYYGYNFGQGSPGTSVFQYTISSGTPVKTNTYTVVNNPFPLCISSTGTYVYTGGVGLANNTTISRINTSTNAVTTITVSDASGDIPGICISPDNQYVYCTAFNAPNGYGLPPTSYVAQINTSTLAVTDSSDNIFATSIGIVTNGSYIWTTDFSDSRVINYAVPFSGGGGPSVCFVKGTRILTSEGYKFVEDLNNEDLALTPDGRLVSMKIISFTIKNPTTETAPYRIEAGSLGHYVPPEDICVSSLHAIQDSRGVWQIPMYLAKHNPGVYQYGVGQPVTYYHIECPNFFGDNLIANGLVTESYKNKQGGSGAVYVWNREVQGFRRNTPEEIRKPMAIPDLLSVYSY